MNEVERVDGTLQKMRFLLILYEKRTMNKSVLISSYWSELLFQKKVLKNFLKNLQIHKSENQQ